MSKILVLWAIAISCYSNNVFGQRKLDEGSLLYEVSIKSAKSGSEVVNSMSGATVLIQLRQDISRTDMTTSLGTESTVYDAKTGKGFILKEYSGQKLMITTTKQNWLQKNQWNNTLQFSIKNELEKIGEYNCKKATAKGEDGRIFTVYFAPDITVTNKDYNNSFDQLNGLPVKFELQSGDITFTYLLRTIKFDPISPTIFAAPKAGFRVMTYEENQQLKKGK